MTKETSVNSTAKVMGGGAFALGLAVLYLTQPGEAQFRNHLASGAESARIVRALPPEQVAKLGCQSMSPACHANLMKAIEFRGRSHVGFSRFSVSSPLAPQPEDKSIFTCLGVLGMLFF